MGAPSSLLALLTYIPLLVERSRSQGKQIFKVNFEVRSHITFGDFYVVFQHMFFFVCVCLIQHQKHRHPKIVGHDFEMMMNFTGEDMDVFAKFETQRL